MTRRAWNSLSTPGVALSIMKLTPMQKANQALAHAYLVSGRNNTPSHLTCPITQDLFDRPVVNAAGMTYSYEALSQHIHATRKQNTYADPLTRRMVFVTVDRFDRMTGEELYANHFVNTQLHEFKEAVGQIEAANGSLIGARVQAFHVGQRVRDGLLAGALMHNDQRAVAFFLKQGEPAYSLRRAQKLVPGLRAGAATRIQAAWRGGQSRVRTLADAIANGDEAADTLEKHTSKPAARALLRQQHAAAPAVRVSLQVSAPKPA